MISSNARAIWDSLVRTVIPILVGSISGGFTAIGINPDPEFKGLLATALTGIFSVVYYLGVRLLEVYVAPKYGWLLGLANVPQYESPGGKHVKEDSSLT